MRIDDFVLRLKQAQKTPGGWTALCPAHDDHRPSLGVTEGSAGRILVKCHSAGCTPERIVESMGLSMSDLFAGNGTGPNNDHDRSRTGRKSEPKGKGHPTKSDALRVGERSTNGKHVATWIYDDANRNESFCIARFDLPEIDEETGKQKKTFRPIYVNADGWHLGDPPGLLPLYRLPELVESKGRVYVTEGEKAADALHKIGLTVTTSSHGLGSAHKSDWTPLVNRDVVVLPDEGGTKYAEDVAKLLPKPPRFVALPDLPPKGDAVEFIESRDAKTSEEIHEEIETLANAAPDCESVEEEDDVRQPVLIRVSDVERKPVDWLWKYHIAIGKISMLASDPGLGKSHITLDIAARVSRGDSWPDGDVMDQPGEVILLSAEDDVADTIRPRLEAAGADLTKIHMMQGFEFRTGEDKPEKRCVTLEDVEILDKALQRIPGARLIVIDPISAYLGVKTDSHKNSDVRTLLAPIADLAERHGVAVVCVTHLNKSSDKKAIYRTTGSLAFAAAARAVFAITRDEDNSDRRLFLPVKNNLAPDRNGLAFTLTPCLSDPDYMRVVWEPGPLEMSADEAMNPGENENRREWQYAADWLRELLADESLDAATIKEMGKKEGYGRHVLDKAKDHLGVRSQKSGFGKDSRWVWRL